MWADDPEKSWLGPWSGLVHCDRCHTLMPGVVCPSCGRDYAADAKRHVITIDGKEHEIAPLALPGALSRTTHSLLSLMKREWERPIVESDQSFSAGTSQRLLIVILFWTLFEHHMYRFFDAALSNVPERIRADLLRRYATIGSRIDRLYKLTFGTSFEDDLKQLGHGNVYPHLMKVQNRRNEFVHGASEALDDALVRETVEQLPAVQAAWLTLYNHRCTGNPNAPCVWESDLKRMST